MLVSTPIGNLGDMAPRGVEVLRTADFVLCEDTRVSAKLFSHFGLSPAAVWSLHEHNEDRRAAEVLERLRAGSLVALVSDAGTPLVSDPGYRLVRAAIAAGAAVSAVPGPNAAVTALAVSGLPPHPFLFAGFLPPREGARRAALAAYRALESAGLSATLIFYEAPGRIAETLADAAAAFGPERSGALARELTKRFETVLRGPLGALAGAVRADPPRGEITWLVGPAPPAPAAAGEELDTLLASALAQGMSVRDAAASVAAATGAARARVYRRALALRSARHDET